MNIAKNMELIFVATIALIGATSYASAALPTPAAARVAPAPNRADMQVVTITAKRLTAAEKAQLED